jgi:molybdenum cofactor biosynthesis protein B
MTESSSPSHRRDAAADARARSVSCAILTISDTRTSATDKSGALIERLLADGGHVSLERSLVRDEPDAIRHQLETWLGDDRIRAILTTGGTGIARRDSTVEVVRALLTVELEGFGELFRSISYDEIGASAMLSRAVAGLVARNERESGDTLIFAMPGSANAVKTAMTRLILPELSHLVWERVR